jgi:hypothetical protein
MAKSYLNIAGLPLGLRNNNPGNVRPLYYETWQGQIGTNQGFAVFENMAYGIRAMAKDIKGDIQEGTNTIRKIITEYSATDRLTYTNYVAINLNLSPDQTLVASDNVLFSLCRQMINFEIGSSYIHYVTDQDIWEGIALMNGGNLTGPVGFTLATGLLLFALVLFATRPKMPKSKSIFT